MIVIFTCCAVVLAGLVAGAAPPLFLAAAAGAVVASWMPVWRRWAVKTVFVNFAPEEPDIEVLGASLQHTLQLARRLDCPVALRVSAPASAMQPELKLDLTDSSDIELTCGGRHSRLVRQPGVWIAEHPLPLIFGCGPWRMLYFRPTTGGRLRVSQTFGTHLPGAAWLGLALVAALAVIFGLPALLALSLGFAVQTGALQCQEQRSGKQP